MRQAAAESTQRWAADAASAAGPPGGAARDTAARATPKDMGRSSGPHDDGLLAARGAEDLLTDPGNDSSLFVIRAAIAGERARIARELHDSVDEALLGIATTAASLASRRPQAGLQSVDDRLYELSQLARRAVHDTRRVISRLHDDVLGDVVRNVAAAWGVIAGVRVSLSISSGGETTEELRTEIIGILRQVLRNVEQHAHATRIRVSLRRVPDRLLLTVADNGRGFYPPADLHEPESAGCRGLIEIAERADRMRGVLVIKSRPGRGTRIAVRVPAPASQQWRAVSAPPARVVIAEQNPGLRLGLRAMLERAPDFDIVGEAGCAEEVAEQVRRHQPDLLVADAWMPIVDVETVAAIRQISPSTEIVMLSFLDEASIVMRAIRDVAYRGVAHHAAVHGDAGHGKFEPDALPQIALGAAGRRPAARSGAQTPIPGINRENGYTENNSDSELTPREREVMGLIAEGFSNRQIAARLVISEKTVKNHICNIYQRFGVSGRSEAVSYWREITGTAPH